jgi:hypothetical protein
MNVRKRGLGTARTKAKAAETESLFSEDDLGPEFKRRRGCAPDRLPPHSVEAEQGVLGCIMLSPSESMPKCIESCAGAEVFHDLRHRTIYETFSDLYRCGIPIDIITVQQELRDRQQFETVGGLAYLSGLQDATPAPGNLEYYLGIVLEKYAARERIKEGHALIERSYQPMSSSIEPPRVAQLTMPEIAVTFDEWSETIRRNFPALVRPAETCLSVVAQLLLNDVTNPFALGLVDVPASGKTITLNFFHDVPELAYTTDNFTAAAFVSHASNVKREDLGKIDLLPRIRYRTLIVRDLGSVFGASDDDLIKSLGILTRVLDGEGLELDSGVHGKRGYRGNYMFNLLAGTTPLSPRTFKLMGNFGSRLFFLALHTPDTDEDELVEQNRGESRTLKEAACRKATGNFLRGLWAANPKGVDWNKESDPTPCLRVIARCSQLLAALRGAINVWISDDGGEKISHSVPVIEKPQRINCLLYNLARGHALVCGRWQLTESDLASVIDVTFDSAPTIRARVFRAMIQNKGVLTTSDVMGVLRCSPPTARKEMEALCVLGVAEKTREDTDHRGRPQTEITIASKFPWFVTDECRALWQGEHTQGANSFKNPDPALLVLKKEIPPCVCVDEEEVRV